MAYDTATAAATVSCRSPKTRSCRTCAPRFLRGAGCRRSTTCGSTRSTGAITFGRDNIPLPLDHHYAVPWREVKWGYKEFTGRTVTNSVLRPVAAGPCPMPAGDFAPYGVDGPRACMELKLCSVTEPGFAWHLSPASTRAAPRGSWTCGATSRRSTRSTPSSPTPS